MNLTEQIVNSINQINLTDSLNSSLLKLLVKCMENTVIPDTNELIIYVDTAPFGSPTNSRKSYHFNLNEKLKYYQQIGDEFLLYFDIKENDIVMKSKVSRKIEYNASTQTYSVLSDVIEEEVEAFPIVLFEGINYIYTNYTNADLTVIYPKNTELNKLLVNSAIYYNHKITKDGEFSLDDIYFKDCFTKTEDKYNLDVDNINIDCITSKNNKFSLDTNGNSVLNSISSNTNKFSFDSNGNSVLNSITSPNNKFSLDANGNLVVNSISSTQPITNNQSICNLIYPVGSIYLSVNNTNPKNLFGGTWVAWGSGRVPVGVNTSDSSFSSVEKTGGSKTHTLTTSEMPSHTHAQNAHTHSARYRVSSNIAWGSTGSMVLRRNESGDAYDGTDTDAALSTTAVNQNTGGDSAHNNLQPYITCYMWKRTA